MRTRPLHQNNAPVPVNCRHITAAKAQALQRQSGRVASTKSLEEGNYPMNLLRALFDPHFLMSGVAIVRDIPLVLWLKQVDGSLFFKEEKRQEYRQRVEV